jgi:hypothetical protein
MANSFSEAKKEYFKTLKQYVPIVERVSWRQSSGIS